MNTKLVYGLIGALVFFALSTAVLLSIVLKKPNSSATPATLSPTIVPSPRTARETSPTQAPENKPTTFGHPIRTFEEAVTGVKQVMKPYTVDIVRVRSIEIIQKPNKTQYEFLVNGRLNPRQSDEFTKPVYDYKDVTVTIFSSGEYDTKIYEGYLLKSSPKYWDDYADISLVTYDQILKLAETRVVESGKTPGDIVTASFDYCMDLVDSCTSHWEFGFVVKGQEKNEKKDTIFVEFKDNDFQKISEGSIELTGEL